MVLKLVPPSSVRSLAPKIDIEGPDGVISTATPSLVGTLSVPASPSTDRSSTWHDEQVELLHPPEPAGGTATTMVREPGLRKRRRTKGYALFSDEDCQTASISGSDSVVFEGGDGDEFIRWRKATDADGDLTFDEPLSVYDPEEGGQSLTGTLSPSPTLVESLGWLVSSILPQYIEKPEIAQVEQVQLPDWSASSGGGSALDRWSKRAFGFLESVLATFTMYSELSGARLDSQFEKVFERLQSEWTFTGGLLVALAAIDTAVFAIAPGSIFGVSRYAKSSIAASSIASGLGIACDAWFLMRYNWTDVHTFRKRALDVYGTYFFFALSARVPAFSMLLSSLALMVFMSIVAYDAWPEAVIVMSLLFGVVMSLQFLVFGAHWCAGRALWVVRWLWMGLFIGSRGLKTGLGGRGSVVDVGGENAREEVKVEVEIPPAYAHTAGEK